MCICEAGRERGGGEGREKKEEREWENSFICKIQMEKFENIINNAWKHI